MLGAFSVASPHESLKSSLNVRGIADLGKHCADLNSDASFVTFLGQVTSQHHRFTEGNGGSEELMACLRIQGQEKSLDLNHGGLGSRTSSFRQCAAWSCGLKEAGDVFGRAQKGGRCPWIPFLNSRPSPEPTSSLYPQPVPAHCHPCPVPAPSQSFLLYFFSCGTN